MVAAREFGAKNLAGFLLLGTAVVFAVVGIARIDREVVAPPERATADEEAAGEEAATAPLTVYYFHAAKRCETCLAIESETERVLREDFADELASGRVVLEVVDLDSATGAWYRDQYELSFGTVVLQDPELFGPFDNLSEVWTKIKEEPPAFEDYLREHLEAMLEGGA